MSLSFRSMTFRCQLALMLCTTLCSSIKSGAQVQVSIARQDCVQDKSPCTTIVNQQGPDAPQFDVAGAPPFGPGQIAIVSTGAAVFGLQDEATVAKGEPYQAQAITEMKQDSCRWLAHHPNHYGKGCTR